MGHQKIYSKSSQKYGRLRHDSRRHARKHVQLHSAVRSIAQPCATTESPEFGEKFQSGIVYFWESSH